MEVVKALEESMGMQFYKMNGKSFTKNDFKIYQV